MKLILISGKAESGKDYTAFLIKEFLQVKNKKVLVCHYADLLKYICKTFFDWNGEKDEAGRTILQKVGTDKIRKINPNYWVEFIATFLKMFEEEWDVVIIPDTRFSNEITYMKERFDVITLRINRPNYISKLSNNQLNHLSETSLDNYKFDYYIFNDGTKEGLYSKLIPILIGCDLIND